MLFDITTAKAVFAHYMVGTVTQPHAQQDVADANAMGLDGFALNIGDPTPSFVADTVQYLFDSADSAGFKLFFSLDVSAAGAAGKGPFDYADLISTYSNHSAYYKGPNGHPFISTFSDGGLTADTWMSWRSTVTNNESYFVPDFDGTQGMSLFTCDTMCLSGSWIHELLCKPENFWHPGYYESAQGWWDYWGDVADGFFSWESAWPALNGPGGNYPGDVSLDQAVMQGTSERQKSYMMPLSTLQYKDAYSTNLYRSGDLNLPVRMENLLDMSTSPDFVEVISWNDGPESHYIGNLWPESNTDYWPAKYSGVDWPHTGWQPIISSFIEAFKSGVNASSMTPPLLATAVGSLWYQPSLKNAICGGATPAGQQADTQYSQQPAGFNTSSDALNWAVVMGPLAYGYTVRAISNGQVLDETPVTPGLNHHRSLGVQAGNQSLELVDALGLVVMRADSGRAILDDRPDGIYNLNYVVVELSPNL